MKRSKLWGLKINKLKHLLIDKPLSYYLLHEQIGSNPREHSEQAMLKHVPETSHHPHSSTRLTPSPVYLWQDKDK